MSARREHRLRNLMRRVEYLEAMARVNDGRLHDMEKLAAMPTMVIRAESDPAGMSMDAARMPLKSKRGILQRIMDFLSGR